MTEGGDSTTAPRSVTRADVARYAGVSTAVVSYVVNSGPRPVAAETAARVRDAIALLGYQPNANARALKLGTSGLLGLLVPDTGNPFFAELALAIEQAAGDRGFALLVANSGSDPSTEARLIKDLSGRQLDGMIIAGAADASVAVAAAEEHRVAAESVFIDTAQGVHGRQTMGADKCGGALLAVRHLLDVHGHESAALIMGRGARDTTDEREIGWRQSLQAAGRTAGVVIHAPFTRAGGYRAGRELLARHRPTAVFVSSDLLAIGLLRAAHEAGISVPDDLAVVSFDGTQQTEYCWPPLTTVAQPIGPMAEAAVAVVLDAPPIAHRLFDVELILRRSCGCP